MTKVQVGIALLAGYVACVWLANWALERWGIVSIGFGMHGPAGLYFAGLTFGLRDGVQDTLGRKAVIGGIVVGAGLAYLIAPAFAIASGVAFLVAETADFAVYTPLRQKEWGLAVLASNAVGAVVDSLLFLWLAFDWATAELLWRDQSIGKLYMAAPFVVGIWIWRNRDLFERVRSARAARGA